jgi:putative DNA-invertase from lambdoid prophage Rac
MQQAAIYLRVSTQDQDVEHQRAVLQRMAEARGYTVVREIAEHISGSKRARKGLQELLQGAHAGKYGVVLVWAIDRLGRTMAGVLETIQALDRLGCAVVSQQEAWLQTDGPVRPLLIAIFGWVAEQERTRIIARTQAGLDTARRRGVQLGRPRKSVDLDRALELQRQGKGLRAIALELGVGLATLHARLRAERAIAAPGRRQAARKAVAR